MAVFELHNARGRQALVDIYRTCASFTKALPQAQQLSAQREPPQVAVHESK